MPVAIRLPAISADFEAGTIGSWHKGIGDRVEKGDVLFEVESDKAVVAVEAQSAGTLGTILIPAGARDIAVDTIVGFLLQNGESDSDIPGRDVGVSQTPLDGPTDLSDSRAKPPQRAISSKAAGRTFASPLARRLASERGVDLSSVTGRGPNGRILKADIESDVGESAIQAAFDQAPSNVAQPSQPIDKPNTTLRKAIARHVTAAKRDIPHFYLTIDCELDALLTLRQQLNEHFKNSDLKVSINDFVIKAAALALRDVPAANVSWSEQAIRWYEAADISMAIAISGGVVMPIVRNADKKSLSEIAQETKKLAIRASARELAPDETQGGGFSISNLGMYGIKSFSAIINAPQSCILAIGAGEKRAIVRGEQVSVATMMTCTLSVDHRAVDGAVAAELLDAFKHYIERPAIMLLPC